MLSLWPIGSREDTSCQWEDLRCFLSSCLRPARQSQPGGKNVWCQDLVTGAGDLEHSVSGEMRPWLGHSSAANLLQTELDSRRLGVGDVSANRSLRLLPHSGLQT